MKSEFMLAFNQICTERNLPRDVVLQALQMALVQAYRRDVNASAAQTITAEIDSNTGAARIFVEKEVVEQVQNPQTEVSLEEARAVMPDAQLNDLVMIDSTPKDFGRVAAQMAKQVILQRVREAERDAQYNMYAEREGEIINGVVQSITSQAVTLSLGRTEALLPKNQQVPGERYTLHQRLCAYVMEVRKSSRGPQIIVSRSHKNMLRRLLELEVPEIANGIVEIKSIAREAGARSKIAVAALQAGVDPVGSCVGMKGVRIQSIVNELNGEKIDVIEWSSDPTVYISKSLSPARVLAVYAEEHPQQGKIAQVVVPDDQLSLAIGREGQNARLAAKLTGWRIDIKSATEAATELVNRAQENEWLARLGPEAAALLPVLKTALERHAELQVPWNSEELQVLRKVLDAENAQVVSAKKAEQARGRAEPARPAPSVSLAERRAEIEALLARIPEAAHNTPLDAIGLSERVLNHLHKAGLTNVAGVLQRLAGGDEAMLSVEGIGPKALTEIKSHIEAQGLWFKPLVAPVLPEQVVEAAPTPTEPEGPVAEAEAVEPVAAAAPPVEAVPAAVETQPPPEPVETPAATVETPPVEAPPALQELPTPPTAFVPLEELVEEEEEEEEAGKKGKPKKGKDKRAPRSFSASASPAVCANFGKMRSDRPDD